MQNSSAKSFLKFTFGFVIFLMLSFGLTVAANTYAKTQTIEQAAAAALSLMLK